MALFSWLSVNENISSNNYINSCVLPSVTQHTQVRCHIVHLSASRALPMIRSAQARGVPLSVETCHHYLTLAAEQIPDNATQYKCCPPIRDAHNQVTRRDASCMVIAMFWNWSEGRYDILLNQRVNNTTSSTVTITLLLYSNPNHHNHHHHH